MSEEEEILMNVIETRLAKNKKDFEVNQSKTYGKRPNIIEQIINDDRPSEL